MTVRLLIALLLGVTVALLIGCSDRGALIPANSAAALSDDIAAVQRALDEGDCDAVSTAARQLQVDAGDLPTDIDRKLRKRVRDGAAQALKVAPSDCQAATTATQTTDTTTIDTTTIDTTTIDTTTTPTTPTTTIPTTTTPTTPDGTGGIPPTETATTPALVTP
jgi:hypothetical protein